MAEINYDEFLPEVLPYAPNCSEPQAVNAIRNACIEFCRDTLFLQQDLDPISVTANIGTYDVEVPTGYKLGNILSLYWDNILVPRKSQAELEKMFGINWQTINSGNSTGVTISTGTPKYYTQFDPDTFTVCLTPTGNLAAGFTGRISLIPTKSSTTVDDKLKERFSEAIASGALGRLLRTPNEPYTDLKAAMGYISNFRVEKQNVASYVKGGMNRAPLKTYLKRLV